MGIREKRVGMIASYSATILSLAIGGWLMVKGHDNPRAYTSGMYINHHNGYGTNVSCRQCHTAPKTPFALGSIMTCTSSKCHGELVAGVSREDGFKSFQIENKKGMQPNAQKIFTKYMDMHEMAADMSCIECHSEHKVYTAPYPEGWDGYEKEQQSASISIPQIQIDQDTSELFIAWANVY